MKGVKSTVRIIKNPHEIKQNEVLVALEMNEYERMKMPDTSPRTSAFIRYSKTLPKGLRRTTQLRFFYMATWLGYSGYLVERTGSPLKKEDLGMRVGYKSEQQTRNFLDELKQFGLVEVEDGLIYLNKDYVERGTATVAERAFVSKIYISPMRSLFHNADKSSMMTLGYVFDSIPYLNYEYNQLCHNPGEVFVDQIVPLTFEELADRLEYSRKYIDRLRNIFLSPTFVAKKTRQNLAIECNTNGAIMINPLFCYGGDNYSDALTFYMNGGAPKNFLQ